jgi:hypothetical protein
MILRAVSISLPPFLWHSDDTFRCFVSGRPEEKSGEDPLSVSSSLQGGGSAYGDVGTAGAESRAPAAEAPRPRDSMLFGNSTGLVGDGDFEEFSLQGRRR